jgi:hypothetical protein
MLLLCATLLPFSKASSLTPIHAQAEATDSGEIDPEIVKENIKKRIEQAAKNRLAEQQLKKVAYIGRLNAISMNSFILETLQGSVKQASTSSNTTFVQLPNGREVTIEDAAIGDYIAALGFLTENNEVLDSRRMLIMKEPPELPNYKSFFGYVDEIDSKLNRITLVHPKGETAKLFSIGTKAILNSSFPQALRQTDIEFSDIATGDQAIVIYQPQEATDSPQPAIRLLIRTKNAPSPTPEIEE